MSNFHFSASALNTLFCFPFLSELLICHFSPRGEETHSRFHHSPHCFAVGMCAVKTDLRVGTDMDLRVPVAVTSAS